MKISRCFRALAILAGVALAWSEPQSVLAAGASVSIVDFAFNPASVTVQVNDSVTWTWVGPTVHTTTSDTGLWDSGFMGPTVPTFSHTFASSGSFPYLCTVHPFMKGSVIVNPAPPSGADLGISISGSPNPDVVSNQLSYTIVVANAGPADVPDAVVTGSLPANAAFVSVSVSQGSATQNAGALRWDVQSLVSGAHATATVVVLPLIAGTITNTVAVAINGSTVTDPNPDNNTATDITVVNPSGTTGSTNAPIQLTILTTPAVDQQTGLFEQSVRVGNTGSNAIPAVRLIVLDLPPGVVLYNASGSTNGEPYVEYDKALGPDASVDFLLEFYRSNRLAFIATNFQVIAAAPTVSPNPTGTLLELDRVPFLVNGTLVIEFASVPGKSYVVEYSSDMQIWSAAVPHITATGTRVQWVDSGPPQTVSPPGAPGQRFYRVVQLP